MSRLSARRHAWEHDDGQAVVDVVEFTDPGCVWAWGTEAQLRWLRTRFGDRLRWRRVFGVQIDDLQQVRAGTDPVADAEDFRAGWLRVAAHTGAPLPRRLAWMHRSTRPAARAAKAAEHQGREVAERVLRRLREAVFVTGRPADTPERVTEAVAGVPGLDVDLLLADAAGEVVRADVEADWAEARYPRPEVIGLIAPHPHSGCAVRTGDHLRYAFPTLVLTGPAGSVVVPGHRPLSAYLDAVAEVAPDLRVDPGPLLGAEEALARFGTLSEPELGLLVEGAGPPRRAVPLDTGTSRLWLHPAEAAARALPVA